MSASNVINKFFKGLGDLIREEQDGKISTKKVWGHIIMALVGMAFIFDGLHWYEMNVNAFNSMLIAGCTLIGLRTVKDLLKKPSPILGSSEKK